MAGVRTTEGVAKVYVRYQRNVPHEEGYLVGIYATLAGAKRGDPKGPTRFKREASGIWEARVALPYWGRPRPLLDYCKLTQIIECEVQP